MIKGLPFLLQKKKQAIEPEATTIISTTTAAIATLTPITKQPAPFAHKPVAAGVIVEDWNGLDNT